MASATPSPADVRDVVASLAPPGTPLTTPEIAAEFGCTDRTVYNKLDALVDEGVIETKKVGAKGRVWWRPPGDRRDSGAAGRPLGPDGTARPYRVTDDGFPPVVDAEMVGVIVWDGDFRIRDANDAFLEMAGLEHEEALGTSWRELTPEEFYPDSRRHIEEVEETGSGVPYEKQYYHADGSRWWGLFESRRVSDDEVVEFVVDVTERMETERALRESEERLDAFVTATSEVVYRMSPDWSEMYSLDGQACVADTDGPGQTWLEKYIPADARPGFESAIESAIDGESTFELEHRVLKVDGTEAWMHFRAVPMLDEDGEIVEWFGTANDITERKRAERRVRESEAALERLNAASRKLIDADVETIGERAAELARDVLDVEYAALWRYDETAGELREHDSRVDPTAARDSVRPPDGFADRVWETFVGDGPDVGLDPDVGTDSEGTRRSGSPLRSWVLVPLGRHGVLCVGSVDPEPFDERVVDLAETVAATVETAWDRAGGEQQLAARNEELERLDRLNALIRGIDQALVDAGSRAAIEEAVCERLADSGLYEFAWVGERDLTTETVAPREWAGVDGGYLETLAIPADGSGPDADPVATAARTGELQVVADVAIDPRAASWREATLARGGRSCIAIPLQYDGTGYGVLAVYADHPQPDERDHAVLAELGETIAHAIDAVETKRTLLTDSVTEVTLEVRTGDDVLAALAREADCEVTFDGLVPQPDGATRLFFTTDGCAASDVRSAATRLPGLAELDLVRDDESGAVFEATATGATVASHVVGNGGLVRSLVVADGTTTAVVDLPADASVREFVRSVEQDYPDTELVARTSRNRAPSTRQDLRETLSERLTDRQREVLEVAYRSGYFESPRVRTGRELSAALDVTQSTFSHHLREAERRLCELVFENV